jgi:hypothetical protein
MERDALVDKLHTRTSMHNAQRIADALDAHGLTEKLSFLRDGSTTSVFRIDGSNLVFKAYDCRNMKTPRVTHSRFILKNNCQATLSDPNERTEQGRPSEIILEIEPELTHSGVTLLHQEMLRYKFWTEEGLDFWDHMPARSYPNEIKNTMLDHRGVPYQIDEDAVRTFNDITNDYPPDANGRRNDEQYLHYRANSWDNYGRPDVIESAFFAKIVEACKKCDWPTKQDKIFDARTDHESVRIFANAFNAMGPRTAFSVRA